VAQNSEISTSKLNLKAQNIHIKLLSKPLNKPWAETDCLSENLFCKNWPKWRNFAQSGYTVYHLRVRLWLCPDSTVVDHLTPNPTIKCLNPVIGKCMIQDKALPTAIPSTFSTRLTGKE
jgi:hypothetical protein